MRQSRVAAAISWAALLIGRRSTVRCRADSDGRRNVRRNGTVLGDAEPLPEPAGGRRQHRADQHTRGTGQPRERPGIVGWLNETTHSMAAGQYYLAALMLIGAITVVAVDQRFDASSQRR